MKIICGIDPGAKPAVSILEVRKGKKLKVLAAQYWDTKDATLQYRLSSLPVHITRFISKTVGPEPELTIGIERPFGFSVLNMKTFIVQMMTLGAIYSQLLQDLDTKVVEISPQQAKISLTGNGKAEKIDMVRAAQTKVVGWRNILRWDQEIKISRKLGPVPNEKAEAIADSVGIAIASLTAQTAH